eukprot:2709881-Rhodomonas_salina.1
MLGRRQATALQLCAIALACTVLLAVSSWRDSAQRVELAYSMGGDPPEGVSCTEETALAAFLLLIGFPLPCRRTVSHILLRRFRKLFTEEDGSSGRASLVSKPSRELEMSHSSPTLPPLLEMAGIVRVDERW